jgi:hypothetical protein
MGFAVSRAEEHRSRAQEHRALFGADPYLDAMVYEDLRLAELGEERGEKKLSLR